MGAPGTLLETVASLLERTYAFRAGVGDVGAYVIGDRGFRTLYAERSIVRSVGSGRFEGAQTLLRQTEQGLAVCVYFPDTMIEQLERHPPQHGISPHNFEPFATFVEEIDHLLLIADRARTHRPVSLLELELQANVSKYLVLSRFLAGSGRPLEPSVRAWLRQRLFEDDGWTDDDPESVERYRQAAEWAARFLVRLAEWEPTRRLAMLRRFHAAPAQEKVRLIELSARVGYA